MEGKPGDDVLPTMLPRMSSAWSMAEAVDVQHVHSAMVGLFRQVSER